MSMTKQDFETVAWVLRETKASQRTIVTMASALTTGHPRFDVARFIAAATPPHEIRRRWQDGPIWRAECECRRVFEAGTKTRLDKIIASHRQDHRQPPKGEVT